MIVSRKMAEEAWELLLEVAGMESVESVPYEQDELLRVFKWAAKASHPDVGGSAEAFAAVDRAKHVLLAWLRRSRDEATSVPHGTTRRCHMCDGKGFVMTARGFSSLRTSCGACRGSGDLDTEHDHGEG